MNCVGRFNCAVNKTGAALANFCALKHFVSHCLLDTKEITEIPDTAKVKQTTVRSFRKHDHKYWLLLVLHGRLVVEKSELYRKVDGDVLPGFDDLHV